MFIIKPDITYDAQLLGVGPSSVDMAPSVPAAPKAPQQIKGSRSSAPSARSLSSFFSNFDLPLFVSLGQMFYDFGSDITLHDLVLPYV